MAESEFFISATNPTTGQEIEIPNSQTIIAPAAAHGRLSLSASNPYEHSVVESDVIYYHPVNNRVALHNGTGWVLHNIPNPLLNASASSEGLNIGSNYDVFLVNSLGQLVLEFEEWADNTNRNVSVAQLDGVWVEDGNTDRRLIGCVRIVDSSGAKFVDKSGDHAVNERMVRYVVNIDSPIKRYGRTSDTAGFSLSSSSAIPVTGNNSDNWAHNVLFPFDHWPFEFMGRILASPNAVNPANLFHLIPFVDGSSHPLGVGGHIGTGALNGGANSCECFLRGNLGMGTFLIQVASFTNLGAGGSPWTDVGGGGFGGMWTTVLG